MRVDHAVVRRRRLARTWADRAVRSRAARALHSAGHVDQALSLSTLPPLDVAATDGDGLLDAAHRAVATALTDILNRTTGDDVLLALFAAKEALAVAGAESPKPAQMRELVQALHLAGKLA